MSNGKDVPLGTERRRLSRIGRLASAALAGLGKGSDWLADLPAAPRGLAEPLEARQLLSAFSVSIAAPPTVTAAQQFYVYVWTSGGTMSGDYTVDPGGGGGGPLYVAPSATSRVTAIPITYAYGTSGSHTIKVTATNTALQTASQTCGMDDLGNYPAANGGPTTFVPSGAGSATPSAIVVDPGTGYTFVAETYNTSSGGHQMALTRLDANDLPDTTWGTYVSGSTYTGTLIASYVFDPSANPKEPLDGCDWSTVTSDDALAGYH